MNKAKKVQTKKRYSKKNRKKTTNKSRRIIFAIGITAVALLVATYAWFIGITTVNVNPFQVNIVSTKGLTISLDGKHYGSSLDVSKGIIEGTETYGDDYTLTEEYPTPNNVNHWATSGNSSNAAENGLEPVSSSGILDASTSQADFYAKTTMTAEKGGYRLLANKIPQTTPTDVKGYIAFDIFIKNDTGATYNASTYDRGNDEALFLTGASTVTYDTTGSAAGDGIQNSVRVGFFALGRVESVTNTTETATAQKIQGISCSESTGVMSLCNLQEGETGSETAVPRGYNWNIWEPNDTSHTTKAINRFTGLCIKRDSSTGGYEEGNDNACTAFTDGAYANTYAVKSNITSLIDPNVNVYDGHNGYLNTNVLQNMAGNVLTSTENSDEATRNPLLYIAPASITKIRIYIWLEGQDIDNFDIAEVYQTLNFNFGFTKDRYEVVEEEETTTPTSTESPENNPGD